MFETIFVAFFISCISSLNDVWNVIEGPVSIFGLLGVAATVWWWLLPRYTAIACHDGSAWLNHAAEWTTGRGVAAGPGDLAMWPKSWLSQYMLGGQRLGDADFGVSDSPKVVRHHIRLFGARRGIYYVLPILAKNQKVLEKFGRRNKPNITFPTRDHYPPLH